MHLDLETLMKTLAPLALLVAAVLVFTGCTSGLSRRLARMPDGRFATATLEETGKFSTTTIRLTAATKDNGLLTAEKIDVSHSNAWLPKFEFHATGYVVQLTPAEKKKPLPAPESGAALRGPTGEARAASGDSQPSTPNSQP